MEDVLKQATWGMGAQIARTLKLTPQGWSSRLRSQPLRTIKESLLALKSLGKACRAQIIIEDFQAFVRAEFQAIPKRKIPLWEIVDKLQFVIRLEIAATNRFQILEAWRELLTTASWRVRELSVVLDSESRVDYGACAA